MNFSFLLLNLIGYNWILAVLNASCLSGCRSGKAEVLMVDIICKPATNFFVATSSVG